MQVGAMITKCTARNAAAAHVPCGEAKAEAMCNVLCRTKRVRRKVHQYTSLPLPSLALMCQSSFQGLLMMSVSWSAAAACTASCLCHQPCACTQSCSVCYDLGLCSRWTASCLRHQPCTCARKAALCVTILGCVAA